MAILARSRERNVALPTNGPQFEIAPNSERPSLPCVQLSALFETLTLPPNELPAPSDLAHRYHTEAIPRLQAVLPHAEIPLSSSLVTAAQCNSVHLRLLIYAVTNNLAGLGPWNDQRSTSSFILEYLERLSTDLLRAYNDTCMRKALFRDFPSMRPLTETLFRAAVTVGNVNVAKAILSWPESGVNVDEIVIQCDPPEGEFTALEFAAHRQDLPLVVFLVEYGAELQGYRRSCDSFGFLAVRKREVLECALCPSVSGYKSGELPDYDDALVQFLVHRGAQVQPFRRNPERQSDLHRQMTRTGHEETFKVFTSKIINKANQSEWMESGFFHIAFQSLEQDLLHWLLGAMNEWQCDLGHCLATSVPEAKPTRADMPPQNPWHEIPRLVYDHPSWYPLSSRRPFSDVGRLSYILDICAASGHLGIITRLLESGVTCSSETLAVAIAANHIEIAQYLLRDLEVDIHQYSTLLDTTPLAEAIYLSDQAFLESIDCTHSADLGAGGYKVALRAAAAVGDVKRVRNLLEREDMHPGISDHYQRHGIALAEACYGKHTETISLLLEAAAATDAYIAIQWHGKNLPLEPLAIAAHVGHLEAIEALLDHDASEFYSDKEHSAAGSAAAAGDMTILKALVSAGRHSAYAFSSAIRHGHTHVAKELLEMDISIHAGSLHVAVAAGDAELVKLVLAKVTNSQKVEAFLRAGRDGNEILMKALCDSIIQDYSQYHVSLKSTFLTLLVLYGQPEALGSFLSVPGACSMISQPTRQRISWLARPLLAAVASNRREAFEFVKILLETGADANILCYLGTLFKERVYLGLRSEPSDDEDYPWDKRIPPRGLISPLLAAVTLQNIELVDILVKSGADVNLPAQRGVTRTPIQQAAESGSYAIVKTLLMHGADINALPAARHGANALQLAASGGYIGIAELLIDSGAGICAAGSLVNGRTAIECAALNGRFDMVNYLASQITIPDDQLNKAMEGARQAGHAAIADAIASILLKRTFRPVHARGLLAPLAAQNAQQLQAQSFIHNQYTDFGPFRNLIATNPQDHEDQASFLQSEEYFGGDIIQRDADYSTLDQGSSHHDSVVESVAGIVESTANLSSRDDSEQPAGSSQFKCKYCQVQLSNASSLSRHKRTKHASPTAQHAYRCNQCSRRFPRKDLRDRHQATHDKNAQMYEACPECHQRHRKDYLKKHIPLCRTKAASRLADQGAMATMLSTFPSSGESSAEH